MHASGPRSSGGRAAARSKPVTAAAPRRAAVDRVTRSRGRSCGPRRRADGEAGRGSSSGTRTRSHGGNDLRTTFARLVGFVIVFLAFEAGGDGPFPEHDVERLLDVVGVELL